MSVWVEMITFSYFSQSARRHAPRERVSWNCRFFLGFCQVFRHAPRERVSWNDNEVIENSTVNVTLHVSVWVEIWKKEKISKILICHAPRERVSWNSFPYSCTYQVASHAPRERVSWNDKYVICGYRIPVTLHVSVWVEICGVRLSRLRTESRSTWACELKFWDMQLAKLRSSHAPRERVSWNADFLWNADETKCHAPRERVSWNFSNNVCSFAPPVTLHVSVWVEIKIHSNGYQV